MLKLSPFVASAVLLAGSLALAQQPDQPVFRSSVRTVPIYATVIDSTGRLVPGLEQSDFTVLDNNKPAENGRFAFAKASPHQLKIALAHFGLDERKFRFVQG